MQNQPQMPIPSDFWEVYESGFAQSKSPVRLQGHRKLEKAHEIKLPESLLEVYRQQNGRYQNRNIFPFFDQDGFLLDILCFWLANLSMLELGTSMSRHWGAPENTILINSFDGHFGFSLDYRKLKRGQSPGVIYWDTEGIIENDGYPVETITQKHIEIIRLADSFEEFLQKLLTTEEAEALAKASPHHVEI